MGLAVDEEWTLESCWNSKRTNYFGHFFVKKGDPLCPLLLLFRKRVGSLEE